MVLAIDFGGTKMAVGCVTVDGRVLARQRLPTLAERGAGQAVERALAAAAGMRREATDRAAYDGWRIAGVGAVSPGVILPDRIVLAPNVPGWEAISLHGQVAGALPGLPVATGNDVHAAALAEARWGRLRGIHNGLYVNVGTGLAAAVVIDGHVVTGAHRAAGEIGYARTGPSGSGGPDGSGSIWVLPQGLEDVMGGRALGQRASEVAGRPLSAADAFADPDPFVRKVVDEAVSEFGRHLANFGTLLDPERIVIGGGLMQSANRILPVLRRWLAEVVPFPPEVLPAAFITEASLLGAAALAADAATGANGGPYGTGLAKLREEGPPGVAAP
jgi:glucokinase